MQNPRLVPVKRTDKRGVTVTRWVLPGGAASGDVRPIPAPAHSGPERTAVLTDLRASMSDWYEHAFETKLWEGEEGWVSWEEFNSRLDRTDTRVLVEANRLIMERQGAGFEHMFRACVCRDEDPKTALYMLHLSALEDDIRSLDLEFSRTFGGVPMSYVTLHSSYAGLLRYGFDLPADPFRASERDQLRIKALVAVAEALEEVLDEQGTGYLLLESRGIGLDGWTMIQDRALARLVYDRPVDHERIAAIAVERRSADARTIEAVLDSGTSALADGTL